MANDYSWVADKKREAMAAKLQRRGMPNMLGRNVSERLGISYTGAGQDGRVDRSAPAGLDTYPSPHVYHEGELKIDTPEGSTYLNADIAPTADPGAVAQWQERHGMGGMQGFATGGGMLPTTGNLLRSIGYTGAAEMAEQFRQRRHEAPNNAANNTNAVLLQQQQQQSNRFGSPTWGRGMNMANSGLATLQQGQGAPAANSPIPPQAQPVPPQYQPPPPQVPQGEPVSWRERLLGQQTFPGFASGGGTEIKTVGDNGMGGNNDYNKTNNPVEVGVTQPNSPATQSTWGSGGNSGQDIGKVFRTGSSLGLTGNPRLNKTAVVSPPRPVQRVIPPPPTRQQTPAVTQAPSSDPPPDPPSAQSPPPPDYGEFAARTDALIDQSNQPPSTFLLGQGMDAYGKRYVDDMMQAQASQQSYLRHQQAMNGTDANAAWAQSAMARAQGEEEINNFAAEYLKAQEERDWTRMAAAVDRALASGDPAQIAWGAQMYNYELYPGADMDFSGEISAAAREQFNGVTATAVTMAATMTPTELTSYLKNTYGSYNYSDATIGAIVQRAYMQEFDVMWGQLTNSPAFMEQYKTDAERAAVRSALWEAWMGGALTRDPESGRFVWTWNEGGDGKDDGTKELKEAAKEAEKGGDKTPPRADYQYGVYNAAG